MGARSLGQDEQYLTVREILSEMSTFADGALSRERGDFCRFGYATLGLQFQLVDFFAKSMNFLATIIRLVHLIITVK